MASTVKVSCPSIPPSWRPCSRIHPSDLGNHQTPIGRDGSGNALQPNLLPNRCPDCSGSPGQFWVQILQVLKVKRPAQQMLVEARGEIHLNCHLSPPRKTPPQVSSGLPYGEASALAHTHRPPPYPYPYPYPIPYLIMEGETQQTADEAEVLQVEGVDITDGARVEAQAGGLKEAMTRV